MSNLNAVEVYENFKKYDFNKFQKNLTNIKKNDINLYKDTRSSYGLNTLSSNIIVRNNTIRSLIIINFNESLFRLKLMELAVVFSDEEFYRQVALIQPLSIDQIAGAFHTTVDNVLMKKAFDYKKNEIDYNKVLTKKLN